jgi:hypothetical protein
VVHEEGFVDAEAFGPVEGEVAAAGDVLVRHADDGGETAEEEAAGSKDAPEALEHRVEVLVVAGEVEDGVAEYNVEGGSGEGEGIDGFEVEIICWEVGGEGADLCDGGRIVVCGKDFVAFIEEVDEIAAPAAASVEYAHAGGDIAAEELVEEVDIDLAELLLESWHGVSG